MTKPTSADIFICADRHVNGGDAKYIYPLAKEINARGLRQDRLFFGVRRPAVDDALIQPYAPGLLPVNEAQYDQMPQVHPRLLAELAQQGIMDVRIVGIGGSTIGEVLLLNDAAKAHGMSSTPAWLTHTYPDVGTLERVRDDKVLMMGTIKRSMLTLAGRDSGAQAGADLANGINIVRIAAMPQEGFGDLSTFEPDALRFSATANGRRVMKHNGGILPIVLNAGYGPPFFDKHTPANAHESFVQGLMTASMSEIVQPDTLILVMDGGPRNRFDKDMGHDHGQIFIDGFIAGGGDASMIVYEPFIRDPEMTPAQKANKYDVTRAATWIAAKDHRCVAAVSNAEGEHVITNLSMFTREGLPKYIFPYSLLDQDPTGMRQAKIGMAWEYGFNVVRPESPSSHAPHIWHRGKTNPIDFEDPVQRILRALDIGGGLKTGFNPMAEKAISKPMDLRLHGMTPPHLLMCA